MGWMGLGGGGGGRHTIQIVTIKQSVIFLLFLLFLLHVMVQVSCSVSCLGKSNKNEQWGLDVVMGSV